MEPPGEASQAPRIALAWAGGWALVSFKINGFKNRETGEITPWPDKWQPTSVELKQVEVPLSVGDVSGPENVKRLLHDLYWFPETDYCIYTEYQQGLPQDVIDDLKAHGIETNTIERRFYKRPMSDGQFMFWQVHEIERDGSWLAEYPESVEHARYTASLAAWKQKDLDFQHSAEAVRKATSKPPAIFSAKPGFFGFSVDLVAAWKRWLGRK